MQMPETAFIFYMALSLLILEITKKVDFGCSIFAITTSAITVFIRNYLG